VGSRVEMYGHQKHTLCQYLQTVDYRFGRHIWCNTGSHHQQRIQNNHWLRSSTHSIDDLQANFEGKCQSDQTVRSQSKS
jgi:hypothetical protein